MDIQGILGMDKEVRNGFDGIKVSFDIDADASPEDIKALVAQSQKRSAVYDIVTKPDKHYRQCELTGRPAGVSPVRTTTTAVIGAGHAGLAMSRCLAEHSIDHVVIERGEVANSWKTERWDSLRLLTPTGKAACPALATRVTIPTAVDFIERYARAISAPLQTNTTVTSVRADNGGYLISTDRGEWRCPSVVLAAGACNIARIPGGRRGGRRGSPSLPPCTTATPISLRKAAC